MLDKNGFDLWANDYDEAVGFSYDEDSYPFAGYREVLGEIFARVCVKPGAAVLDLGFGTATLTAKLYGRGCRVFGQDFSDEMIRIASAKMPDARLYCGDLAEGLAPPLRDRKYDFVVATYSLHHLTDARKVELFDELLGLLDDGGAILVGDLAFESRAEMARVSAEVGDEWDDEEHYFAVDELRASFPSLTFKKLSFCAGVIEIPR